MEARIPWHHPVFFKRNRVFRVYKGGALFAELLGDAPTDGNEPEEWICSSVRAINPGHEDPLEGISITKEGVPFSLLLQKNKKEFLGEREDLGVLVKYLDSAIRLPMQVHPTREFSRQNFGSPYGKAEAWLILATRPDACIYFGFSREVSREEFEEAIAKSETDANAMTAFVNRVPVKTGDVFFVDAGVIHAIGAGCLILEVQEPTDFTIQPEYYCGDYRLNDREMYLGLDPQTAIDCFHFDKFGKDVVARGKKTPRVLVETETLCSEELIGKKDTPCFSMARHTLKANGTLSLSTPASVWICVDGVGEILSEGESTAVKKGDYFFLPAEAAGKCKAKTDEGLTLVSCVGGN